MIVGEALGEEEVARGEPFVGRAGRLLNQLIAAAGLRREEIYIDNVVPVRPPKNELARLGELGYTIEEFYPRLEEIVRRVQPTCIVAAGQTALTALTGIKKEVSKWRGSVLQCTLVDGPWVVPMLHPSAILREYSKHPCGISDLVKAKDISINGYTQPSYKITLNPSIEEIEAYIERCKSAGAFAYDIETLGPRIRCLGLAVSGHDALVIPFKNGYRNQWSPTDEATIWHLLQTLFGTPGIGKIAQNMQFDLTFLTPLIGFPAPALFDTMYAHHLVCPELSHDLDFLASMHSDLNFYAIDSRKHGDLDTWVYNARDCMATYQVYEWALKELAEMGMLDFFLGYTMPLTRCLFEMQHRGVLIDQAVLGAAIEKTLDMAQGKQTELETLVGAEINVKSSKQVKELFYETLGAKSITHRKRGNVTVDKEALSKLSARGYTEADLLLETRRLRDAASHLKRVKVSYDGAIHTEFVVSGTVTGRLSSREAVDGAGTNLQNIPKHVRAAFVPRPGMCFVKGDLSQAENRYVAWLVKGPMQTAFKEQRDVHSLTASLLFGGSEAEYPSGSKGRNIAKVVNHASNYGQGPNQLAATLKVSNKEGKTLLEGYHRAYPQVRKWHAKVRERLQKNERVLSTAFGRKRLFLGRWGDELFRAAYAFEPQSAIGDYINLGLLELWLRLKPIGAYLLLQIHDELIVECPLGCIDAVVALMHEVIEREIIVGGEPLTIPLETKVCYNSWLE
jgi:DNA polymerase-1